MQQLRDPRPKCLFGTFRAHRSSARHFKFSRRTSDQHSRQPAMLCYVDNLLLGNAAEYPQSVLRRGESHNGIKRLFKDGAVWAHNGEFMHWKTSHRLQHPRLFRISIECRRVINQTIPFRLVRSGSQRDAFAAVAAIRLHHQTFTILLRKVQQVSFLTVRKRCAAIADDSSPQDMAPKQTSFFGRE